MPVEIRVPQLGESVVEATVAKWLKKEGEAVTAGEPVVELETDKVNVEIPADESGILQGIAHPEGETVSVGDLLATISPANGSTAAGNGAKASAAPAAAPPVQAAEPEKELDAPASPIARRLAEENNVDLSKLAGSGANGKITKDDVAMAIEQQSTVPATAAKKLEEAAPVSKQPAAPATPALTVAAPAAAPPAPKPAQPSAPVSIQSLVAGSRIEERVRMSRRRQTIATRLVEAQHNAAMLTTFNEVDMTAIMDVRKRRKDSFKERHGVGLGFMSFFTKASIGALKAFPYLNAEIQGDEIVVKKYYDIGIAVGAEEGLVVPIVRDADKKTFAAIESEIVSLATRAKENKLTLPELLGGTFTLTNGGIFGSLMSTPILNAPQVGILGMHKIQERPIAVNGEVVIRPMMYLALSYDHRIVDGSEAVRFLVRVKELLEDPESLLLEG